MWTKWFWTVFNCFCGWCFDCITYTNDYLFDFGAISMVFCLLFTVCIPNSCAHAYSSLTKAVKRLFVIWYDFVSVLVDSSDICFNVQFYFKWMCSALMNHSFVRPIGFYCHHDRDMLMYLDGSHFKEIFRKCVISA